MLKIFQNSPLELYLKNTAGKILLRFQCSQRCICWIFRISSNCLGKIIWFINLLLLLFGCQMLTLSHLPSLLDLRIQLWGILELIFWKHWDSIPTWRSSTQDLRECVSFTCCWWGFHIYFILSFSTFFFFLSKSYTFWSGFD